ncbi:glycosyltransferase family 2 protein [Streptomyces griseocarneus]|uniref:glycosyltransferase family 2 protein n=1 Tax=Streptomyces griseocarneus TaxID=51201 RepID=UPI00167D56F0|nr:glycosyltransferase family 2 protein [Streptomyces griseocarneus]MBZ6474304.1 glycosyltransferase [Streptomyces griseocarneus]GHG53198.1 glycosyl transferase [Streptomyces griseocarneus]
MTAPAPSGLWVVVPAHQEEARIDGTLRALAAQHDRDFTLVVVDNASTDGTGRIARSFAARAPFPVHVIEEQDKGVGCAVDTAFRYAIERGAVHLARTDADCLPRPGWTAAARAALTAAGPEGALVCGRVDARRDEHGPLGRAAFRAMVRAAALFGRLRPAHARRHGYLAPYRMHAGNNMAITPGLYLRVGGMPRRPSPTDRTFLNRVRRHTTAITHCGGMVVENSTRRLKAYGLLGTARWYLDKGCGPQGEDPR